MGIFKKLLNNIMERINNAERRSTEKWLSESNDIYELERRQRQLERSSNMFTNR